MEYSIYGALILITLLCLWAVITIPKNYLFKSILIPTMLVIAISTWFTYTALLGFGTTFKPSEAVVYHYHISDKKNDRIYVLVTELKEKEPRLHIFPWSEKLKEELDKAGEEAKMGVVVFGKFRQVDARLGKVEDAGDWLFYNMPPNEIFPKDGG